MSVCPLLDDDRRPSHHTPRQIPSFPSILLPRILFSLSFGAGQISRYHLPFLSPSHAPKFSGVLQTGRRRAGLSSSGTRGFKLREGREDRGLSRNDRPFTLMHPIKTGARNQIEPREGKNQRHSRSRMSQTSLARSPERHPTTANVHLKSA